MAKKRKWAKWVALGAVLVLVGGGGYLYLSAQTARESVARAAANAYSTAQVVRGEIKVEISATGVIQSADVQEIISPASGTVTALAAKEGDAVAAGQLIIELDSEDLVRDIERAENTLKQQQINLSMQNNSSDQYRIEAPAAGVVKNIKARVGEDIATAIRTYESACVIVDEAKCYITFSDITVETSLEYEENDSVRVEIEGQVYPGRIIGLDGVSSGSGLDATWKGSMEIEIKSDEPSWEAEAKVYDLEDTFIGKEDLEYRSIIPVGSGSGKVTSVEIRENQRVERGTLLFMLDDTDAQQNIDNQSISVAQSKADLQEKKDELNRTREGVSVPIDGVLSMLSVKQGETVAKNSQIATVTSIDDLEISVDIDELDIPKIRIGQSCTVTVDALTGRTYEGTVTYIASIGVTSGGVTHYEVRASIIDPEAILIGMNSTAKIHIEAHEDALYLPIEALVQQPDGTFAAILEDPGIDDLAPDAPIYTPLATGLVNDNYVEIIDGLEEGQAVYYHSGVATDFFSQMFPMMSGGGQRMMMGGEAQ